VLKILVTGSRTWSNEDYILRQFTSAQKLSGELPRNIELIHGGAQGADFIAAKVAKKLGWNTLAVPADWRLHGKGAGPIRNQQMIDMKPDIVIAFWDGSSRGTADCMQRAKSANIPLVVVTE
jgi:hypothetical protein